MAFQTTTAIELRPVPIKPFPTEHLSIPTPSISSPPISQPPTLPQNPQRLNRTVSARVSVTPLNQAPLQAQRVQQRWNDPPINKWRLCTVFFALINIGANDASYGALLPAVSAYYNDLSYTVVSLMFLSPYIGYTLAALCSNPIHVAFGQRGLAFVSGASRIIAYVVISIHPPFGAVVGILALAGFGNGLADAGWNAWIGDMHHANELLGFLNGSYGLGATISPLIVSSLINTYGLPWYAFFYIMTGLVTLELITIVGVFWKETGPEFRKKNAGTNPQSNADEGNTKLALKSKVTWICSFILMSYVGAEISIGGWLVTYMMQVRHGTAFASSIVSTGFWVGITCGRVSLGFVTPYLGERRAVVIYLLCAIALELLFWRISNFVVSAVMVSFLGFFMGPQFCVSIIAATKLLPKRLHMSAVGFGTALGGCGAAFMPFMIGAIVNARGLESFQPVILALLCVQTVLWFFLPKIPKHGHQD